MSEIHETPETTEEDCGLHVLISLSLSTKPYGSFGVDCQSVTL